MPVENYEALTSETFDAYMASHNGIIICHKHLCPHCKIMGTVLDKVKACLLYTSPRSSIVQTGRYIHV